MFSRKVSLLDDLLNRIAEKLQLNQSRREKAEECYKAVIKLIEDDKAFFGLYETNIYPQGSYRLGTTVKPMKDDEYDLDFVLEVNYDYKKMKPIDLLNHLERRLRESDLYRDKITLKKRCVTINYTGDFHLDIIPALPNSTFKQPDIKISDRKLEAWLDSSPKGYIDWFESKYISQKLLLEKAASVETLPEKVPYQFMQPLQRVVQLMKRHNDIYFDNKNEDWAPRSIVLTVLAGTFYNKLESESESLLHILREISNTIKSNPYGIIDVKNPANPKENFSDRWHDKPYLYNYFKEFISSFLEEWEQLIAEKGIDKIKLHLQKMFGETISREVITEQANYTEKLRKAGLLNITSSGTIITTSVDNAYPIRKNTFYGHD